jgi:hypothetical protein
MKISTIALLAMTMIGLGATGVHAEEPERLNNRNVPEAIAVPLSVSLSSHEVILAAGFSDSNQLAAEKSVASQGGNSVIHVDENNRLVGLSN